jgi:hypothetical protein
MVHQLTYNAKFVILKLLPVAPVAQTSRVQVSKYDSNEKTKRETCLQFAWTK